MEELGIEGACNRLWDCWDAYGASAAAADGGGGVEVEAEGLLQQIQLYNVALKQEDGEPVTEDEIRQVIQQESVTVTPSGMAKKCHCKRVDYTVSL